MGSQGTREDHEWTPYLIRLDQYQTICSQREEQYCQELTNVENSYMRGDISLEEYYRKRRRFSENYLNDVELMKKKK